MKNYTLTERDMATLNAGLTRLRSLAVVSLMALVVGLLALAVGIAALVVAL